MESAEAEGTPQDPAPWTSVRSDAFVVGKAGHVSCNCPTRPGKWKRKGRCEKGKSGLVKSDMWGQEGSKGRKRL